MRENIMFHSESEKMGDWLRLDGLKKPYRGHVFLVYSAEEKEKLNVQEVISRVQENQLMTGEAVKTLIKSIEQTKFNYYGDDLTETQYQGITERSSNEKKYEIIFKAVMDEEEIAYWELAPTLTYLPADVAAAFATTIDDLDLSQLKTLSVPAAKHLGKHQGYLNLNGMEKWEASVAKGMARHWGIMTLNNLKELPEKSAAYLSKNQGEIQLNGLVELGDSAARNLGKHKGGLLLNGLEYLSEKAAAGLAKNQGALALNGLTDLSDGAAKALGTHIGELRLSGLTALSDTAAAFLGAHQGKLMLNGLTELSPAAARGLAASKGKLYLLGLNNFDVQVASELAKFKGVLEVPRGLDIRKNSFFKK